LTCAKSGPRARDGGPAPGARPAPDESTTNWGDLRPRQGCAWEEVDGRVDLLRPRFGSGRVGRFLQRRLRPSPYRVHLDELGSFVWNRCDGEHTVAAIAAQMRERYGADLEPVEDRLVAFVRQLLGGQFVRLD